MGILTIYSGAATPAYTATPMSFGYSSALKSTACFNSSSSPITKYLYLGETFETATKMWDDAYASFPSSTGWYSDGTLYRFWDSGAGVFGVTGPCNGESTSAIIVGDDITSALNSCGNHSSNPITVYVPVGYGLDNATIIYSNAAGTSLSANKYYSDGINYRKWNDRFGFDPFDTGFCGG